MGFGDFEQVGERGFILRLHSIPARNSATVTHLVCLSSLPNKHRANKEPTGWLREAGAEEELLPNPQDPWCRPRHQHQGRGSNPSCHFLHTTHGMHFGSAAFLLKTLVNPQVFIYDPCFCLQVLQETCISLDDFSFKWVTIALPDRAS